jgi:hypothetical protein
VRAQGEAQSARLIGQAIQQNPAFLTLRKIEVRLHVCVGGGGTGAPCKGGIKRKHLLDVAQT